jgi:hypothetical protein
MFVYNTATVNDVLPGVYYNDGTKWIRSGGSSMLDVRQLEITIADIIGTQSVIYHGQASAALPSDLKVLSIEPVFSDEIMAQTLFTVNSSARYAEMGTVVNWSVKVSNFNIDSSMSCILEKVIITYTGEHTLSTSSPTGTFILVGQ